MVNQPTAFVHVASARVCSGTSSRTCSGPPHLCSARPKAASSAANALPPPERQRCSHRSAAPAPSSGSDSERCGARFPRGRRGRAGTRAPPPALAQEIPPAADCRGLRTGNQADRLGAVVEEAAHRGQLVRLTPGQRPVEHLDLADRDRQRVRVDEGVVEHPEHGRSRLPAHRGTRPPRTRNPLRSVSCLANQRSSARSSAAASSGPGRSKPTTSQLGSRACASCRCDGDAGPAPPGRPVPGPLGQQARLDPVVADLGERHPTCFRPAAAVGGRAARCWALVSSEAPAAAGRGNRTALQGNADRNARNRGEIEWCGAQESTDQDRSETRSSRTVHQVRAGEDGAASQRRDFRGRVGCARDAGILRSAKL